MAKRKFRGRSGGGSGRNTGSGSGSGSGTGSGRGRTNRRPGPKGGRRRPGPRREDDDNAEGEDGEIELVEGCGLLELHPNGYGFLRSPENNYSRERTDPFVPGTMIEKFNLREGLMITGKVQPARRQQGPR